MTGLGRGGLNQETTVVGHEFIHGRAIGGDDDSLACHGLDDVMPPAFREGGAKVNLLLVHHLVEFFVRNIVGAKGDVIGNIFRGIVLML